MRLSLIILVLANGLLLAALLGDRGAESENPAASSAAGVPELKALGAKEEKEAREREAKKPGCLRFGPFAEGLEGEGERLAAAEWPGRKQARIQTEEGIWILVDAKAKRKAKGEAGESFGALVKQCSEEDQKTLWTEEGR